MSNNFDTGSSKLSEPSLYETLKNCAKLQSYESLQNPDEELFENFSDCDDPIVTMMSTKSYPTSGSISGNSCKSDESFVDSILEDNGRISLAYENLRTIPRRIADKFASQTKFLDLSHNNFQNLSFLTYFEELHTLILDHNEQLNPSSLPYLPNLEILWLNNCNISNVADWVRRIQRQCPFLKHLSIMGNPGCKNSYNMFALNADCPSECNEYIWNMLPSLQYLNGQKSQHRIEESVFHNEGLLNICGKNISTVSSTSNSIFNVEINGRQSRTSLGLSFNDLFSFKRRKKICQHSSKK